MTATCSGEAGLLFIFIFVSHLIRDQLFKKNLLPKEQILFKKLISNETGGTPKRTFFPLRPYFEKAALSKKTKRKSQKWCPFVKMIENHAGVLKHLINDNTASPESVPIHNKVTFVRSRQCITFVAIYFGRQSISSLSKQWTYTFIQSTIQPLEQKLVSSKLFSCEQS